MSDSFHPVQLPYALGVPEATAMMRSFPADFMVDEVLGFELDGVGEHLWLRVKKTGQNTQWVVKQLARHFACRPDDLGYSGLKDRHAVTEQWISVPVPIKSQWTLPEIPQVDFLQTVRHGKKLKRGVHQCNRFTLTLRGFQGDQNDLENRLNRIAVKGFPNFYGPQRFGHGGANWQQACLWLEADRPQKLRREQKSLWLSSIRSGLFNRVLAQRVIDNSWASVTADDTYALAGSQSLFQSTYSSAELKSADETLDLEIALLQSRLSSGDIHVTGPLCGRLGGRYPSEALWLKEQSILADLASLVSKLERFGLNHERRALRVIPQSLTWAWKDMAFDSKSETALDNALALVVTFSLPRGAFATSLVRELVDITEPDHNRADTYKG